MDAGVTVTFGTTGPCVSSVATLVITRGTDSGGKVTPVTVSVDGSVRV